MNRLDHVHLKAAAFTNLSRDHLDFHNTMENYFAAKLRLFGEMLPEGGTAVLNADVPEFEVFAESRTPKRAARKLSATAKKGKEIKLDQRRRRIREGQMLALRSVWPSEKNPSAGNRKISGMECALRPRPRSRLRRG